MEWAVATPVVPLAPTPSVTSKAENAGKGVCRGTWEFFATKVSQMSEAVMCTCVVFLPNGLWYFNFQLTLILNRPTLVYTLVQLANIKVRMK